MVRRKSLADGVLVYSQPLGTDESRSMTCSLCGAPLEVEHEYTMSGAGFGPPGTIYVGTWQRVLCAAGHRYDVEIAFTEIEEPR